VYRDEIYHEYGRCTMQKHAGCNDLHYNYIQP